MSRFNYACFWNQLIVHTCTHFMCSLHRLFNYSCFWNQLFTHLHAFHVSFLFTRAFWIQKLFDCWPKRFFNYTCFWLQKLFHCWPRRFFNYTCFWKHSYTRARFTSPARASTRRHVYGIHIYIVLLIHCGNYMICHKRCCVIRHCSNHPGCLCSRLQSTHTTGLPFAPKHSSILPPLVVVPPPPPHTPPAVACCVCLPADCVSQRPLEWMAGGIV